MITVEGIYRNGSVELLEQPGVRDEARVLVTFLEPQEKPLDGMYLPIEKAEMVIRLLLEGNSVSSIERVTEVHHATILHLSTRASKIKNNYSLR